MKRAQTVLGLATVEVRLGLCSHFWNRLWTQKWVPILVPEMGDTIRFTQRAVNPIVSPISGTRIGTHFWVQLFWGVPKGTTKSMRLQRGLRGFSGEARRLRQKMHARAMRWWCHESGPRGGGGEVASCSFIVK